MKLDTYPTWYLILVVLVLDWVDPDRLRPWQLFIIEVIACQGHWRGKAARHLTQLEHKWVSPRVSSLSMPWNWCYFPFWRIQASHWIILVLLFGSSFVFFTACNAEFPGFLPIVYCSHVLRLSFPCALHHSLHATASRWCIGCTQSLSASLWKVACNALGNRRRK